MDMEINYTKTIIYECKFCSTIITKKDVVFETENLLFIDTKTRLAPIHYIIIPKRHISQEDFIKNIIVLTEADEALKLLFKNGYRMILNVGLYSGQCEEHAHIHVFGGCQLRHLGI